MNQTNIILSIIIAAHNAAASIKETFASLLDALKINLHLCEIIIVNDASVDQTAECVLEFMNKFQHVKYYEVAYHNVGKVRNYAITHSCGTYITMLDADDLVKENSLDEIIDFLGKNNPDLLLTKLHEVHNPTGQSNQWCSLLPEKINKKKAIRRFLIHKDIQGHLIGQFILRKFFIQSPVPSLMCYEDFYVLPGILMQAESILFSKNSHYLYVKRSGSLSSAINDEKVKCLICVIKHMEQIFGYQYQALILCHWIDCYLKYKALITDKNDLRLIMTRLSETKQLSFFINFAVRLSYKRKAIMLLWKM